MAAVCRGFPGRLLVGPDGQGPGSATHDAFANPGLLLLVFAVTVLSAGFHEFGHAAAARRGGATPGAMGAGLYLVWPAFFTDVTDSYRLGRGGRLRTDLGGLYFNAIVAVAIMGIWWATGFDALLLVVVTQILQMVRQLLPLVRFDGYHVLADADRRARTSSSGSGPRCWDCCPGAGASPTPKRRCSSPGPAPSSPSGCWSTVPLLLFSLVHDGAHAAAAAGHGVGERPEPAGPCSPAASSNGDLADAAVRLLAIAAVALPVLGIGTCLLRLARQLVTGLWAKTKGKPLRRGTAMAADRCGCRRAGLGLVARRGQRTAPCSPMSAERSSTPHPRSIPPSPAETEPCAKAGQARRLRCGRRRGVAHPGQAAAQPGPRAAGRDGYRPGDQPDQVRTTAQPPLRRRGSFPSTGRTAPDDDGNQALAVNSTDGSVTYDVAFALVWADGGPVDTRNEAYAFANCTDCAAVAVGFQVVLIVGQADVVVPENLSAAANYNCVRCLTYALASQLVLTLDGPLSEDGMARLNTLWQEIAEFGRGCRMSPSPKSRGG